MKVCLASTSTREIFKDNYKKIPYLLESFYYFKDWQIPLLQTAQLFLVDSGAFTFMNGSKGKVDFNAYLDKYIDFINKNNVKHFFELDIDSVVGYDNVKKLRTKLEQETGKKCIPVWHKSRGLEEWKLMCKEYDYVAIGGIVTKEIGKEDFKYFKPLLEIARQNNCKVHGLGFTAVAELPKYKFYSVDSTSWLSGGRYGQLHAFRNNTIENIKPKNVRAKNYKQIDYHNLEQWLKYQEYADKYL